MEVNGTSNPNDSDRRQPEGATRAAAPVSVETMRPTAISGAVQAVEANVGLLTAVFPQVRVGDDNHPHSGRPVSGFTAGLLPGQKTFRRR